MTTMMMLIIIIINYNNWRFSEWSDTWVNNVLSHIHNCLKLKNLIYNIGL